MATYSNIHRRQLFHWIGSHIEARTTKDTSTLTDEFRREYIACLRGALKRGLWVKTPRDPDRLGDDSKDAHFQVNRPISCFTEWLVGESLPHTSRYGRLGLGFPRSFVLKRGGHPVIYVRGIRSGDQYTKNLLNLRSFLADERLEEMFGAKTVAEHRKRLDYITHFAKQTRKPPVVKVRLTPRPPKPAAPQRPGTQTIQETSTETFERNFGRRQELLEEREWRIVHHSTFSKYFTETPKDPSAPDYYLPFETGNELFTVVLPDNRTVNMVMNERFFIRKFYPTDAPHVTVLSLQDIGTF